MGVYIKMENLHEMSVSFHHLKNKRKMCERLSEVVQGSLDRTVTENKASSEFHVTIKKTITYT